MSISVQQEDFDVGAEIKRLQTENVLGEIGAIVTFTGQVRSDGGLTALHLDHYPGMTERQLEEIAAEALSRWPLKAMRIIHRHGTLNVGDNIVLVITAAEGRKDAFEAANFLMDWLKTKAPFWKKEMRDGSDKWVEAKASDDRLAARWDQS